MSAIDNLLIHAQIRLAKAKEGFKEFMASEKGVTAVVATIIILVITILLVGVFWDRLQGWVNGLMDQIFGETYSYGSGTGSGSGAGNGGDGPN